MILQLHNMTILHEINIQKAAACWAEPFQQESQLQGD